MTYEVSYRDMTTTTSTAELQIEITPSDIGYTVQSRFSCRRNRMQIAI